jgi:hypothetical protein
LWTNNSQTGRRYTHAALNYTISNAPGTTDDECIDESNHAHEPNRGEGEAQLRQSLTLDTLLLAA